VGRDEAIDREQLFTRLTHLRTVVPVFAQELARARRQAASLRATNGWLLELVRQLQRQPARKGHNVELTDHQSARIETLSDDCAIVGAQEGRPLVRLVEGDVALLEPDGRLTPAEHGTARRHSSDHRAGVEQPLAAESVAQPIEQRRRSACDSSVAGH
jgi:hypothetical protein